MSFRQEPTSDEYSLRTVWQEPARAGHEQAVPLNGVAARLRLERRIVEEPFPLILLRRAREATRTHVRRAVIRASALLLADLCTLLTLKLVVRYLTNVTWLHGHAASVVSGS